MDTSLNLPPKIKIADNVFIGPKDKCFIIAEIGQNHQGNLDLAKNLILSAKQSGADCVKFQKSHLSSKFNKQALLRPYNTPNSWGVTYGAHKEFLEFSNDDFVDLQNFCIENNILFSSSVMDEVSLEFVNSLNVPFIKIGSGDFHNKLLLKKAATLCKPLIISTGMSNLNEVIDCYKNLKAENVNFCLLHCVSSYPVPLEDVNLNVIKTFKKLFPDINIGYSGHELGTEVCLGAVALGAKIIEKHFTLNKAWKGTDHACSLTPDEFKSMVTDIRKFEAGLIDPKNIFTNGNIQKALGSYEKKFQNSEYPCYLKLGKTVIALERLLEGDKITFKNVGLKVAEPKGIPGKDFEKIIGKTVKRDIEKDESIFFKDLK